MMNVVNKLRALGRDDSGQDLLEYALLVGLIALVAYVAVQATGSSVFDIFNKIATDLGGLV